jgi:hypothetical protein
MEYTKENTISLDDIGETYTVKCRRISNVAFAIEGDDAVSAAFLRAELERYFQVRAAQLVAEMEARIYTRLAFIVQNDEPAASTVQSQ